MTEPVNRVVRLRQRARNLPGPETWRIADEEVRPPRAGEVLVRVHFVSIDPAMRGWIEPGPSYIEPVAIGDVMRADAVGEVVESRSPDLSVGDWMSGWLGVQRYWTGPSAELRRIDGGLAPPERYLGALGLPGLTAYFGLLEVGRFMPGDRVAVSGAAGAVGAMVGQIARLKGASRVVGIAGGPVKCAYLVDELGFDAVVDYKQEPVFAALRRELPQGLDLFFDNVGGDALEAGLMLIRRNARVVICGAISAYNDLRSLTGPPSYFNLVIQRGTMSGFIVLDYAERFAEARAELVRWLAEGRLKAREHVEAGLDRFPDMLRMLFRGENFGKLVLRID